MTRHSLPVAGLHCWVVRDADGEPYDDEWDTHHASEKDAFDAIRELKEIHEEDQTPEEYAAEVSEHRGAEAGEIALRLDRTNVARRESLHPVVLDGLCYTITCDGDGPNCWEQPNGDEGTLHFGTGGEFDPAAWDFTVIGDKHYCGDCDVPEATA